VLTVLTNVAIVALAVAAALTVAVLIGEVIRRGGQRVTLLAHLHERSRRSFRVLACALALYIGFHAVTHRHPAWAGVEHALVLVAIAAAAWFGTNLLLVLEETALIRVPTDVEDNRHARAVHTQVSVLRRLTALVVAVVAIAAMLMTFRSARLVGTSLLASAGVVAAIAAFAANTLLGNVVAGLQLAFGGSVRLEDVVVVDGEWGRVEAITLTYVVLHLWDDRRMILPTSYLTSNPFENWTHTQSALLGTVELDVDWSVSLDGMRERLRHIVTHSPLWDGRVSVVQAIDAELGRVKVRALLSAHDAPTLWDLRCAVREGLVAWVRDTHVEPRVRADTAPGTEEVAPASGPERARAGDDRVFGGDVESSARGASFAGPRRLIVPPKGYRPASDVDPGGTHDDGGDRHGTH
jgi:small-conductance mechanosensitive channel